MPLYVWKSLDTGKVVEVLRSFKDSDVPPNEEEKEGDATPDDKWQKQLQNFTLNRAPGFGKKGAW